jgi:hypothetical protein
MDRNWMDGVLSRSVEFIPTYGKASHETPHRNPGVEQYIRHIPTAGPIMEVFRQQAKAHPNFTRALSLFRPDP